MTGMTDIGTIDKAELFIVKLPLVSPFVTSYGSVSHRESLLLKLTSGKLSGWGECAAFRDPDYYHETIDTSLHIAAGYLIPRLLKASGITPSTMSGLFTGIRGHHMPKAMIENAVFDLAARMAGVPLFKLLGGRGKRIRSGISLGIPPDIDTLLDQIRSAVKKKYHRVKVKIKKGWDLNIVSAIRSDFPYLNLVVDANGDYTVDDIPVMQMLDKFDLKMIEQPLAAGDLLGHSKVQEKIDTPLGLDESINGIHDAANAVFLKSGRIICIKQGRVGGLSKSLELMDFCLKNDLKVCCGGMLETGIGRAFNIHLQSVDGFELPGDISETSRYFEEDIVMEPVVLDQDGYINLPGGNGSGTQVDEEKVERFMVFRKILKR